MPHPNKKICLDGAVVVSAACCKDKLKFNFFSSPANIMESMSIQQINLYLATCTLFYSITGKYSETPIK